MRFVSHEPHRPFARPIDHAESDPCSGHGSSRRLAVSTACRSREVLRVFRLPARAVRRALVSAFMVSALIAPGVFPRLAAAESLGIITIVQANPANPSQAFHYTANVPEMASDFYLDQDPTTYPQPFETSSWVTPGSFEVQQDEPPLGWDIAEINCTDPQGNSTGEVWNRRAVIQMDANEEIVCTFTMAQAVGDINIYQSTVPQTPISFQYGGDFGAFSLADDGDEVNDGTWRNQGFSGV